MELKMPYMAVSYTHLDVYKRQPPEVRAAMLSSAVALLITTKSLTHTHARVDATNQGVRIASLPGITEDIMTVGAMTADYRCV